MLRLIKCQALGYMQLHILSLRMGFFVPFYRWENLSPGGSLPKVIPPEPLVPCSPEFDSQSS